MKYIYTVCCSLMLLALLEGCSKNDGSSKKPKKPPVTPATPFSAPTDFRVVGYLIGDEIASGAAANFDPARVNYLNITFDNTDANGKLPVLANLTAMIALAHKNNTKVLGTIGNGTDLSLITAAKRAVFIDSLVASVDELQLDGIDVDFEGTNINSDYEGFIGDLSAALKLKGKLITAAVATWETQWFTDKALSYFDFLNVMSYDDTGPWDPSDPGQHSPFSMAVDDLNFWSKTRGISTAKLNVGVPFYGYGFGPDIRRNLNYKQIIHMYPGAENRDSVIVHAATNSILYYNGLPTIIKKSLFAKQNAGGIMIWELMEDSDDDNSLLSAIDSTLTVK
jgi:chitinase